MNNRKGTSISEWSILPVTETNILDVEFMQNNDADESIPPSDASIIIDGINSNISSSNMNTENPPTIDFESNKREDEKISLLLLNSKSSKPIEKSLETVLKYKKSLKVSTFYQSIQQYEGVIQEIDKNADTFTAALINIDDKDDIVVAAFNFKDVALSDRELIRAGAIFIWLMGQEMENGTIKNITKFIFRRTRVIRGKALQEAKDEARELAELFSGIGTAETVGT